MIPRTADHIILFILGGAVAFALVWYLLGVGIGIAQRGYNRVAPYRIQTRVVPPPYRRGPRNWDEWESGNE
jgi:hypothetical protein